MTNKHKQSIYLPDEILEEIKRDAIRLDRSLSWLVQRAWKIARDQIQSTPTQGERVAP